MFFFGPEYRPVPLDQTFVGITEKQKVRRNDIMNQNACDKMTAALERGKQVMIFVHSRKETSRTAEAMRDLTGKMGVSNLLENFNHEQFGVWKRAVEKSRSTEVQQLFFQVRGYRDSRYHTHTYAHIYTSRDLSEFASQWTREIEREFRDELVSVCHVTSKLIMLEGAREIKISNL